MKSRAIQEVLPICALVTTANCTVTDEVSVAEASNNTNVTTSPSAVAGDFPIQGVGTASSTVSAMSSDVASNSASATSPGVASTTTSSATANMAIAQGNSAGTATGAIANKTAAVKNKGSWWDAILKLFKVSEPKRTSEQALVDMEKNQNVVIDFSNVTDFATNGDERMAQYYQKIISTKAFGTKSPNIYVNLSNTNVTSDFIAKWSAQFKKDKKTVIWNLSENKNLDDSVVEALDFSSIYSLNLSGTLITDAGIAKISAILETNGIGNLVCIHLSNTKVTDAGVASLKASMQKALEVWMTQNPGTERKLQGADNSGVVFEKIPELPTSKGAVKRQPTTLAQAATMPSAVVPDASAAAAGEASQIATAPAASVTEEVSSDVNSLDVMNEEAAEVPTAETPTTQNFIEQEANNALNSANAMINMATEGQVTQG